MTPQVEENTVINARPDVLIIGGGVIGICSAYYLQQQGLSVTLLEQNEIGSGSSYGNGGLIVPSHSTPLAAPGALAQALKSMWNPASSFYIKPRFDRSLFKWLWRFWRSSNESAMRRSTSVLVKLAHASRSLYNELIPGENLECDFQKNGLLVLFKTTRAYEKACAETHLLEANGVSPSHVHGHELRQLEPGVRDELAGGIFLAADANLNPARFVNELAKCVRHRKAHLYPHTEVKGFETSGNKIMAVKTTRGDFYPEQVILAAGSWSSGIARELELDLPIQPLKGYSVTVERHAASPNIPLILDEAKVVVTPMGSMLRLAGTLELAGFDLGLNQRRIDAILHAARDYLTDTEDYRQRDVWCGLRPATPDGLPIVGRSPSLTNLIVAAGHATIGMTLGPITGKLVSQIACDQKLEFDLNPLRVDRFS